MKTAADNRVWVVLADAIVYLRTIKYQYEIIDPIDLAQWRLWALEKAREDDDE